MVHIYIHIRGETKIKGKKIEKYGGCSVVYVEAIDSTFTSFDEKGSIPFF